MASDPQIIDAFCAVVARTTNGISHLFLVGLRTTDTEELIFQKIKKEYSSMAASKCKETWITKIFTEIVVGSAEVQKVCEQYPLPIEMRLTELLLDTGRCPGTRALYESACQQRKRRPTTFRSISSSTPMRWGVPIRPKLYELRRQTTRALRCSSVPRGPSYSAKKQQKQDRMVVGFIALGITSSGYFDW